MRDQERADLASGRVALRMTLGAADKRFRQWLYAFHQTPLIYSAPYCLPLRRHQA